MGTQPYGASPRPTERLKPSAIAKRLGVTQKRVKERIRAMERRGLLAGYQIVPNYRHLGLDATCYYFRFPSDAAADAAMRKAAPLDGVIGLYAYLGGILCAGVTSRGPADLERKLRVLVELAGESKLAKFFDLPMPTVGRPLSELDWRIVRALRGNAMRPLPEVAKAVGVSAKTVKRKLDRLSAEGSFFVIPRIDPSRAEGVLLFYLGFHFASESGRGVLAAIHHAFDGDYISADVPHNLDLGSYALMVAATSMSEVDALRARGAAIKGVAKVEPWLFRSVHESTAWIDEAIDERIKASA